MERQAWNQGGWAPPLLGDSGPQQRPAQDWPNDTVEGGRPGLGSAWGQGFQCEIQAVVHRLGLRF